MVRGANSRRCVGSDDYQTRRNSGFHCLHDDPRRAFENVALNYLTFTLASSFYSHKLLPFLLLSLCRHSIVLRKISVYDTFLSSSSCDSQNEGSLEGETNHFERNLLVKGNCERQIKFLVNYFALNGNVRVNSTRHFLSCGEYLKFFKCSIN